MMEPFPEKTAQEIDYIFSVICIETIKQMIEKDREAVPILKDKVNKEYARFCQTKAGRELADYILSL